MTVNVNIVSVVKAAQKTVDGLIAIGVLSTDGTTFTAPTPTQDAALAALGESLAVEFGVPVPVKVDQLIKMLPLVLGLLG